MDQLRRETQPPAGTPPSPVPQYWNPDADQYERVQGAHGAPRAILYGPNGQPISSTNRLPVDADISDRPTRKLGEISVVGQSVPLRGLASERPAASASNKGYTYWAIDTGEVFVSTGSTWRKLGDA